MYFEEFHRRSKDLGLGHLPVPDRYEDWPLEWKTVYYKEYPHLKRIELPAFEASRLDLFSAINARKSVSRFSSHSRPLTLEEASGLLGFSCGIRSAARDSQTGTLSSYHRAQPSGGARYPIEAYLINFKSGELAPGIYHYNIKEHSLEVLSTLPLSGADIKELFTYSYVGAASYALVLTGVFWRTQIKYGERGYRYILLEAGHIGQNVALVGQAFNRVPVMMGGVRDEGVERKLDIDGRTESVVYGIVIGDAP
jgi:SagB-type dehydrogenase family enzyme